MFLLALHGAEEEAPKLKSEPPPVEEEPHRQTEEPNSETEEDQTPIVGTEICPLLPKTRRYQEKSTQFSIRSLPNQSKELCNF